MIRNGEQEREVERSVQQDDSGPVLMVRNLGVNGVPLET